MQYFFKDLVAALSIDENSGMALWVRTRIFFLNEKPQIKALG